MKHRAALNKFHKRLDAATPRPPANVPGQPVVTVQGRGEVDWRPQIERLKRMGLIGRLTKIVCLENSHWAPWQQQAALEGRGTDPIKDRPENVEAAPPPPASSPPRPDRQETWHAYKRRMNLMETQVARPAPVDPTPVANGDGSSPAQSQHWSD